MKNTADKILFTALAKENMKRAYYSALAIVANHDDAMELSQQAFLRAYKSFSSYDPERNFFTWYYKILRNLCLNFIRDNKNRKISSFIDNIEYESSESIQFEIERDEDARKIRTALNSLSDSDREIIILKEFENYSYKEIAEMLEIPIGSVMSKLHYARKKLAEKIKE
ncbi:MAG: sigma-70 family RNA polymerase sigma factor [Melioribacteraceae bacterium]|nr:sigma-70 family RNA polymerase sigma factor [Melioribacteraceae bacterium]